MTACAVVVGRIVGTPRLWRRLIQALQRLGDYLVTVDPEHCGKCRAIAAHEFMDQSRFCTHPVIRFVHVVVGCIGTKARNNHSLAASMQRPPAELGVRIAA